MAEPELRLVGAASLPGRDWYGLRTFERRGVPWPFAVVELSDSSLVFRLRPAFLAGRYQPVTVGPDDGAVLFPVGTSTLGLRLADGKEMFPFDARKAAVLLDRAEEHGFRVDRTPGRRLPAQLDNWQPSAEYARTRRSRPGTAPGRPGRKQ